VTDLTNAGNSAFNLLARKQRRNFRYLSKASTASRQFFLPRKTQRGRTSNINHNNRKENASCLINLSRGEKGGIHQI
jgi:hypothetical protein